MTESAPDAFKQMLRDQVAPALRGIGLTGSSTQYALPSTTHWALVGFQGSTANTSERMKFTINCKVVRKDVWASTYAEWPHFGVRPKANIGAGTFEWSARIGSLMPGGKDHWWWLTPDDDRTSVANEVVDTLTRYALPAMRKEIARTS